MDGIEEGLDCKDWFFCTKKLPKEQVMEALARIESIN